MAGWIPSPINAVYMLQISKGEMPLSFSSYLDNKQERVSLIFHQASQLQSFYSIQFQEHWLKIFQEREATKKKDQKIVPLSLFLLYKHHVCKFRAHGPSLRTVYVQFIIFSIEQNTYQY